MKLDLHTHYYPPVYFDKIRDLPSEFSFGQSPSGQTIITHRGARFFGVTPPMTDVGKRLDVSLINGHVIGWVDDTPETWP